MGNLKYFISFLFILSGCGQYLQPAPSSKIERTEPGKQGQFTSVQFDNLEGGVVDLSSSVTPIVLFFASDTCTSCTAETRQLVNLFAQKGSVPKNVSFYTLLIGATRTDALDWREALHVPWTVGTNTGDHLFRQFCPELKTPCVLTHIPVTGVTTKFVGASSPEELQEETGQWIF